jgi:parallel beta-helix repeat protein
VPVRRCPFCSITKGVSMLQPGTTLSIGNGTYAEQVKPPVSGTPAAPILVTNIPGASPQVTGGTAANGVNLASRSYLTISGLTITGTSGDGVNVTSSSNIVLAGLHVSGSGQPTATGYAKGIKLIGTTASTVTGSTVDHNTDSGIYLAQGSTGDLITGNNTFSNARGYTRAAPGIDLRSSGNSVIGNSSHDNEDSGIQLYTGDANLVADNVSYRNGDHGIDDYAVTNEHVIGNTVYRNTTAGINFEGGSTGAVAENNISVDNGLGSPRTVGDLRVDPTSTTGTVIDHNLVYLHAPGAYYVWGITNYASLATFTTATGQEAHGTQSGPRWASPDSGDFHLTAGSPAIDSADASSPGEQPVDLAGVARYDDPAVTNTGIGPRGYDDRGAYEAPAGTTDATPTAAVTLTPGSGTAPVSVTADASDSTDGDSTPIASYRFDFGDGTAVGPQSSPVASHLYTTPGTYTVLVSVTDTAGLVGIVGRQVTIGAAGNLIGNSTFESNLTGWAPLVGCDLTRVASGHNGGWAADLANNSTGLQSCTLNDSPNWVARTVAATYTTTAWIRSDTANLQVKLRLREYAGSTLVGTALYTVTTTGDWQQLSIPYSVLSPGSNLDLNVFEVNQPIGTHLLVDDVSLSAT